MTTTPQNVHLQICFLFDLYIPACFFCPPIRGIRLYENLYSPQMVELRNNK